MILYRIAKEQYIKELSGKGAEQYGGRWNSKGRPTMYMAESLALSTAELAVHLPLGLMPLGFCYMQLEIPDDSIEVLSLDRLSSLWNAIPHSNETQILGDEFLESCSGIVLKVPSAVIPFAYNYVLNPSHPRFQEVKILQVQAYSFDSRLFMR